MISTTPSGRFWKHSMPVTLGACGKRKTASRSVNGVLADCGPRPGVPSHGTRTHRPEGLPTSASPPWSGPVVPAARRTDRLRPRFDDWP